jgi:hypothetical protein
VKDSTTKYLIKLLEKYGSDIKLLGEYLGCNVKTEHQCSCGNVFSTTPQHAVSRVSHVKCKDCFEKDKISRELENIKDLEANFKSKVQKRHGDKFEVLDYRNYSTKVDYRCTSCGHVANIWPSRLLNKGDTEGFCIKCSKHPLSGSLKEYRIKLKKIHGGMIKLISTEYLGADNVLRHKCKICKCTWYAAPSNLTKKNPTGCPDCAHRSNTRYKFKEYQLGKKIVKVQGFESKALDILLKKGIHHSDIKVGRTGKVPVINYSLKGKIKKHYPDIYIPSQNRIIEVKSIYTFFFVNESVLKKNQEKKKAAIKSGFKYEMWVLQRDSTRIKLPKNWEYLSRKEISTLLIGLANL